MTQKKTTKTQIPIRGTGGRFTIYLEEKDFKITPKAINIHLRTYDQIIQVVQALLEQMRRGNGEIKLALWRSPDKANEYSPPKYPLSILAKGKTKSKRTKSKGRTRK